MKKTKTIALASGSMLAASMAQGAITYYSVNQSLQPSSSGYNFDLNGDGTNDFDVFFDGGNSVKPCVLGAATASGSYPGTFPNPIPVVFNELNMNPVDPASNDTNGVAVIPFATPITPQITVGADTMTVGDLGGDQHGKQEGYLYQNGELDTVGQWPAGQDTYGYVALAMVDTSVTPATTNYGWVQLELNYLPSTPVLRVIDYAYQNIAGSNILAGQRGPIDIPAIYQSPTNQEVAAGISVDMSVVAMASPAPTYQWMAGTVGSGIYTNLADGGAFSGANSSTLTIAGALPANHLDYVVVVANSNGSTTSSPPATLTVVKPGLLGPVPTAQTIYAGYPAAFSVADLGGVAATNSWLLNGASLTDGGLFSGTATASVAISSVQPASVGNYQAVISTAYGSATSSVASLATAHPDGSAYEAEVLAYSPVEYYRFDETAGTNAWDFVGGRNGTYGSDAVLAAAGPSAATGFPGFASTNYSASLIYSDSNSLLPCLPWNFTSDAVTITAWIYPVYNQGNAGIVFTVGTNNMDFGIRYDGGYTNTNGIDDGNIGYDWGNTYADWAWNSGITAPHSEWSLVALAISPVDATLYIINAEGVQSAVNTVAHLPQTFNATEFIGDYPQSESFPGQNNFNGQIDEVAIFNSTLSSNQVASLYASALGQAVLPPKLTLTSTPPNLQISWSGGVLLQATNLLGPWLTNATATSPFTFAPTGPQQFFRVKQ